MQASFTHIWTCGAVVLCVSCCRPRMGPGWCVFPSYQCPCFHTFRHNFPPPPPSPKHPPLKVEHNRIRMQVFHIGCGGDTGTPLKCTNGTTPKPTESDAEPDYWQSGPRASNGTCSPYGTTILYSSSPDGPWTDVTVVPGGENPFPASADNPTPLFFANGSIWVMFRSYGPRGR